MYINKFQFRNQQTIECFTGEYTTVSMAYSLLVSMQQFPCAYSLLYIYKYIILQKNQLGRTFRVVLNLHKIFQRISKHYTSCRLQIYTSIPAILCQLVNECSFSRSNRTIEKYRPPLANCHQSYLITLAHSGSEHKRTNREKQLRNCISKMNLASHRAIGVR